jgi:hypothetical protein
VSRCGAGSAFPGLSPMVTIGSFAVEEKAGRSGRSNGLGEAARGAEALKARWAHERVRRSEPPGHAFLGLRIYFLSVPSANRNLGPADYFRVARDSGRKLKSDKRWINDWGAAAKCRSRIRCQAAESRTGGTVKKLLGCSL